MDFFTWHGPRTHGLARFFAALSWLRPAPGARIRPDAPARDRGPRRCAALLALAVLLAGPAPRADDTPVAGDAPVPGDTPVPDDAPVPGAPLDALFASQAWELALRRVDAMQESAVGEDWEALERRRFEIYRRLNAAEPYAERVAHLPAEVSAEFRREALEGLLETCLAASDAERAQAALARLADSVPAEEVRRWRKRLARLHLERAQPKQALAVLAPLPDDVAPELRAEALLLADRDREAFEQVAGRKSPEARLWRLIALWRLDLYAPDDAVDELSRLVREFAERPRLLRIAWLARAQAAARAGQLARRVHSLERALQLDPTPTVAPVPGTPDHLWSAYLALARHLAASGNLALERALLVRADADDAANGHEARALYAWLALEADDAQLRDDAHARLARSLLAHDLGAVVRALYTGSERFAPPVAPAPVRHALLREALARGDLEEAARYARDLEAPPTDQPQAAWQLRRARVLLYGGAAEAGVTLLAELVQAPAFDAEFAHRWVQVVFDLQALGRHEDALRLLESAQERVDNPRMRRELLYWQAESASALGRPAEAAELYLRSAQLDAEGRDAWGQSARYRAAEALSAAGLRRDAESVYRALLAETSAPRRRLLIEQHLERLWLDAPAPTTP